MTRPNIEVIEYDACSDCLIAIANDDYSGMGERTEQMVREGIDREIAKANSETEGDTCWFAADGTELGFSHRNCDICGELPSDRYRVNLLIQPKA